MTLLRAVTLAMLLTAASWASAARVDGTAISRVVEADVVESDSPERPASTAAWRHVRLDRVDWRTPASARFAWYRLQVELAAAPGATHGHALYVANLQRQVQIHVNGRHAGDSRPDGHPRRLLCCATYFELPPGSLAQGPNVIELRIASPVRSLVALAPVHVGDTAALWPLHERRLLVSGVGRFAALVSAAGVASVCLLVWIRRRSEVLLLLFGLSTASYASVAAIDLWTGFAADLPLALAATLLDCASAALMLIFMLRFAGWQWPRVEIALWVWVALSVALQLVDDFYSVDSPWHLWWYVVSAAYVAVLPLAAAIAWRRRDLPSLLLLGGAAFSAGMIGWQATWGRQDAEAVYLWPFHPLGLFAVIAWLLVDRLVGALDQSETLNLHLAERVEAKRVELEANYRRVAELESQHVVVAERSRLMSDMHDGIGGQLISTLSLVEGGEATPAQVAAALRECIDDLRLAIDSLEPTDHDLLPLLGNLRWRLEPRLKARGIALDWQVQDVPRLACLTPANVLHVLRILQEAFTNVIKHAGARHVRLSTRAVGDRVLIDLRDDGRGMDGTGTTSGRGLASMRRRAQALGGELLLRSDGSGTTLSLALPAG